MTLAFKADAAQLQQLDPISVDYRSGKLGDISATLATNVIGKWASAFGPENTNPPVPIKLTVTLKVNNESIEIADGLTIQWVNVPAVKR